MHHMNNIASIPMNCQTLVVKILFKHKMYEVLWFMVKKKVVFEQLKLCH